MKEAGVPQTRGYVKVVGCKPVSETELMRRNNLHHYVIKN
jgi:hypothetical protein